MVFAFGAQVAQRDQLAQHRAPLGVAHVGANAKGRQRLVVVLTHLVADLAAHHVDQVPGAEALAAVLVKAVDAAERLACRVGGVPGGRRVDAVVAVAAAVARLGAVGGVLHLAKVGQQADAPAVVRLGQREQGFELADLAALEVLAGRALVDHAALIDHIGQAVGHPRIGGQAVAAGAASLLVVALDVLGQVQVRHEAHVGFVDAHAEGNRGHHDQPVFAQKSVLVVTAHIGVEPRVVRQRADAFADQPGGGLVDLFARLAVDDAGVALVLVVDEAQQLRARVVLFDDGVADVGAVEAADEDARGLQLQPLDDVGARELVGGGGQRDARHDGVALVQHIEREVVLAEVVAPLAHAMSLIDGEQAEQPALVERIELRQKARCGDALGRGVQQHQSTAHHFALDALGVFCAQAGVEARRVHPGFFERAHLIVHQRDQRADHDGHAAIAAMSHDGRHLVAKALAAACGHQHQRIAAGAHLLDHGGLRVAKGGVAEHRLQHRERGALGG